MRRSAPRSWTRSRAAPVSTWSWRASGLRGARAGASAIDVGNAGTLLRLLPGWLAGQPRGRWTLDGDESIRAPAGGPRRRSRCGGWARSVECRDGRTAADRGRGRRTSHGIEYELPVASAQVKSCVLLAGLLGGRRDDRGGAARRPATTPRSCSRAARRHASSEDGRVTVGRRSGARARETWRCPGDFSSAAFFIAAATLVPGSELTLERVGINPTRTGLLRVLSEWVARWKSQSLGWRQANRLRT